MTDEVLEKLLKRFPDATKEIILKTWKTHFSDYSFYNGYNRELFDRHMLGLGYKPYIRPVKSQHVKLATLNYCLFERDMVAVTEGINHSDVLAFNRENRAIEFEIKCSRSDFMSEIKDIKAAQAGIEAEKLNLLDPQSVSRFNYQSKRQPKLSKHQKYLKLEFETKWRYGGSQRNFIPHYFCFVVTADLVEIAKEQLKGVPYGLYVAKSEDWHEGVSIKSVKPIKLLHDEPIRNEYWRELLRRSTIEAFHLRKKLNTTDQGENDE